MRRRTAPVELAALLAVYAVYREVRGQAPARTRLALRNADLVMSATPGLVADAEHWLARTTAQHAALTTAGSAYYAIAHVAVTGAVLGWAWYRRPEQYAVVRTTLVVLTLAALAAYWLFPVAPPRLAAPGPDGLAGLLGPGGLGGWSHRLRFVNPYAAFPSVHAAWACWCAWVLATGHTDRRWRLAWVYPATTALVLVATANHFVIDVAAGAADFALAAWVVTAAGSRRRAAAAPTRVRTS